MNAAPIAGLDLVQQLVAEAAQGRRGGWTLDSTHERGTADDSSRAARRRAVLLQQFGHETRVVDEPDTGAVYVWRRA